MAPKDETASLQSIQKALVDQQRLLNEINARSTRLEAAVCLSQPPWAAGGKQRGSMRSSQLPQGGGASDDVVPFRSSLVLKGRKSRALLDADHSDGDNSADSAEHEKLEDVMHTRMQTLLRRQRSSVGNLMRTVSSVGNTACACASTLTAAEGSSKQRNPKRKASFVLPSRMPSIRKLSCSSSNKVAAAPTKEEPQQPGRHAVPRTRRSGERLRRALALRRYALPDERPDAVSRLGAALAAPVVAAVHWADGVLPVFNPQRVILRLWNLLIEVLAAYHAVITPIEFAFVHRWALSTDLGHPPTPPHAHAAARSRRYALRSRIYPAAPTAPIELACRAAATLHLIISSPYHLITSSPHHLIISSPHHLVTSSPHHLITSQARGRLERGQRGRGLLLRAQRDDQAAHRLLARGYVRHDFQGDRGALRAGPAAA